MFSSSSLVFLHEKSVKPKERISKIDITFLHPFPEIKEDEMGDFIRNKIRWYYKKNYEENKG